MTGRKRHGASAEMRGSDIRNMVRQMDAIGEFSNLMLGDMAVDRGGPEDIAYRALTECFSAPIERHAELVRYLNDGGPVAQRMLRRLSADYPTRSRAFMHMRDMVNRRFQSLTDNIAAHPENAARHIVDLERSFLNLSDLLDEVTAVHGPLHRTTSLPVMDVAPTVDAPLCSICFESVIDSNSTACSCCNKRVHTACLNGYRNSVGHDVACPTCRRAFA